MPNIGRFAIKYFRMKFYIVTIIILTVCSCKTKPPRDNIEVYFSPGLVEYEYIDPGAIDSIKTPDRIYVITSSDYSFLHGIIFDYEIETQKKALPPYIFFKYNSILYIIGGNRVIESEKKTFMISERDDYRIKSIIHFYNFIDKEDLKNIQEIKRFGIPADYHFIPSNPHSPTKPFVKIVLRGQ